MTIEGDPRTRVVLSWLREDAHENAERMLLRAIDEVDATPQRRSWWPAWRSRPMNTYARLIAAAAAVLVVAVVGYQFLPARSGPGGPAASPSPTPSPLAQGSFHSKGIAIDLDAIGAGSDVTGLMTWDFGDARVSVDVGCTRTTPGGLIVIGGDVTTSTYQDTPKGSRVAIVLQRGSPVLAHPDIETDPPAATCMAYLEGVTDADGARDLEPIEAGDHIELGP